MQNGAKLEYVIHFMFFVHLFSPPTVQSPKKGCAKNARARQLFVCVGGIGYCAFVHKKYPIRYSVQSKWFQYM